MYTHCENPDCSELNIDKFMNGFTAELLAQWGIRPQCGACGWTVVW